MLHHLALLIAAGPLAGLAQSQSQVQVQAPRSAGTPGAPGPSKAPHAGHASGDPEPLSVPGGTLFRRRITEGLNGFTGSLQSGDWFGRASDLIGDFDGDGIQDLVVTASKDGNSGNGAYGSLWLLFMNRNGTVREQRVIRSEDFTDDIEFDRFGISVACLGDLDLDGTVDLAVGAPWDDDGDTGAGQVGTGGGAVWILFLQPDGTVRSSAKISSEHGGITGIAEEDWFGHSLALLDDFNGDGIQDLAVGAPQDRSAGAQHGAVWLLALDRDGSVREQREIVPGDLVPHPGSQSYRFGGALAPLGDFDGNGVGDLIVGDLFDGVFASGGGAAWLLFLEPGGTVGGYRKIESEEISTSIAQFGAAVGALGDLDGNGVTEIAVGLIKPSQFSFLGGVRVLFLNRDASIDHWVSMGSGFDLHDFDFFGEGALGPVGDLTGDGVVDLVIGAFGQRDAQGDDEAGVLWFAALDGLCTLDFETEDDRWSPLEDGRGIATPGQMGHVVEIDGFPNYGPQAALFDSAPGGPNEWSEDPDLLVGLGNVLILQLFDGQSTPGVYDAPNDDPTGGHLEIRFREREVSVLSIDLIDIDPGPGQGALVVLFDSAGRTRSFLAPAGWTEDVSVHGGRGYRTLDLNQLAPQPGFMASAVAGQDLGFRPDQVVSMRVELFSSGAIDNLVFDPRP